MELPFKKKEPESKIISNIMLANVDALARGEVNEDCPNGCLTKDGSGCWCYGWHYNVQEAHWN